MLTYLFHPGDLDARSWAIVFFIFIVLPGLFLGLIGFIIYKVIKNRG
jgi:hypothetical protein